MDNKKIEIDFMSGEALKSKKVNIVKSMIKTKLIIIIIFFVFIIFFCVFITTDNAVENNSFNTDQLISPNTDFDDNSNVSIKEETEKYIKLIENYNESILLFYKDLKNGYLSTTGFSNKIEKLQKDIYHELNTFSKFEKAFKKNNSINTYNFLYSRMANMSNCISSAKKLISEKEIKIIISEYIKSDQELINLYSNLVEVKVDEIK